MQSSTDLQFREKKRSKINLQGDIWSLHGMLLLATPLETVGGWETTFPMSTLIHNHNNGTKSNEGSF